MEDLGLRALHRRVAGIDVHRMLHVVTVLIEQADGSMQRHTREFGGFRRDCRALAQWLSELGVELVVMESTGIYWKSVHAHLENAGIPAWVVNAHMIKHVPGRKTDMADSEWLAVLARFGLVRASFIPPKDLRELRLVSRYRRKLSAMCASQINRLHKILDDGGIKLGGVVSDINGVSARAMVSALIAQQPIEVMLGLARGRLKQKREDLGASLEGDLSARHLFVLGHIHAHIQTLQRELAEIDRYLLAAMQPYAWAHQLLQTSPGIDRTAAALILIEIGEDMARFGSPARMTKSTLASKYRSLMVRKSHKKAIVAVAHKMIRLIFVLLSRRQPYLDQGIDYAAMSAKKNAPRWIKQLKTIGRWPSPKTAAASH